MATETVIPDRALDNAEGAYRYAQLEIRGRFPEGEHLIAQVPYWAYCYARYIIKAQFELGETAIAQDSQWAFFYSFFVIKRRSPAAEPIIVQSIWAGDYFNCFQDQFTEHERVIWLLSQ